MLLSTISNLNWASWKKELKRWRQIWQRQQPSSSLGDPARKFAPLRSFLLSAGLHAARPNDHSPLASVLAAILHLCDLSLCFGGITDSDFALVSFLCSQAELKAEKTRLASPDAVSVQEVLAMAQGSARISFLILQDIDLGRHEPLVKPSGKGSRR